MIYENVALLTWNRWRPCQEHIVNWKCFDDFDESHTIFNEHMNVMLLCSQVERTLYRVVTFAQPKGNTNRTQIIYIAVYLFVLLGS